MLGATTMIMEDTQVINWEVEEEEEVEERPSESLGCSLEPLGRLRIFSSSYGPEKDFPLYLGKNVVGRMPDCSVALPYSSISKQHAVIEILAWDKAPVLRDCGSLNGTQILRPPKVLGPGVSHRLRDRELILFADLPCQYHRLDVPLPFVFWGPLTVEETPRVQGGTQPHRLLLAEDSEEEVDSLSEKCVVKGPRTSFLATVVPESDEEGPSSALDGPGPPFAFNLNSDTDEEESQQPGAGEGSSAARRVTTAETEQPKPVTTEIQLEKDQCSVKEKNNDTKVERKARSGVVPVGVILERSQPAGEDSDTDVDDESGPLRRLTWVHLERAQPCGFIDSDTDMEEEGIPATPAVVPVRKRHIFHEVGTESPRVPGMAHRQESPAGSDTDIEEGEAPLTVPLDRSRASVVIHSNTDDKEKVSAALTLAHLRESRAVAWNRDPDAEDDRAQPVALLERSQASAGRDSDTDLKKKGLPVEKTGTVPRGHTGKAYSEKSQPPLRDSDTEVTEEKSSPGFHLERSQASATVHVNTQVVEEVPPGPAVILLEKHRVPVAWTHQTDVKAEGGPAKLPVVYLEEARPPLAGDCDPNAEENTSLAASAVADVRKSQLQAEEDTGTECAVAVLEQGRAFMAGAQGGSPAAQVEQDLLPVSRNNIADLVADIGTPGEPTQPQSGGAQTPTERERGPHVDRTMDSGDNHDDSEDLDLQATQCFVERENQSLEVPSMEDEPTQAFLFTLPQEPGPSRCSFQATGSLDEPWEVLATQPFCPRESEASETQPIATHIEAHASCPSPPMAAPQEQHPECPVHAEPLGIQGRGIQTVEEDMGYLNCKMPPAEKASRGDQESPDACRPPALQEASAPLQNPLTSQSQKHPAPQSLLSPSPPPLEPPIPRTRQNESQEALETPFSSELDSLHPKPKVKPQGSSPVSSVPLEPHPTTSTDQLVTPKPTSRATRGRTLRSSVKTPEQNVSTAPELQPSAHTDQPVTPKPTSLATRGRTQRASVKTPEPVISTAPAPQPSTSTDQPVTPKPTSLATRGRTLKSSVKTPEQNVSTAPELQASTSTDQPVTPKPTSLATRGRTLKSSVKTPEQNVSTAPELQASAHTDQPVTPKPTSLATRGRTLKSSVKTPEQNVSTAPELQASTSTDQPVTPKPTSRATRGRTLKSSVKTPEQNVSTVPELQASAHTDQPVTPKPTSRATRGRTLKSSVKTPEQNVSTAPELQASAHTDQPVTPKPTSRATRGRTQRASVKTPEPVISTAPAPQASTDQLVTPKPTSRAPRGRTLRSSVKTPERNVPTAHTDQPVTPKPTSRAPQGRTLSSSAKTPEPVVPITPEPQPSTSKDQSLTPEPTSQATRGRTRRSSVKTSQPTEPTAPDLEPSSPTEQPATPKVIAQGGQSRTLRSSTVSAVPVPTTPESHSPVPTGQPVPPEPIPETNCSRRPRATRKHGSLTAHVHEPYSAPSEPNSWSSRNQRRGAVRAAQSLSTIPEPAFAQLPEAPTRATQIPKGEAADRSAFTPEPQPEASQNRKRPLATADSPPLQKRLRREVPQKTAFLKEEENPAAKLRKEEDVVIPGPGKRKRTQTEEEPQEIPSRSLRRTKPIQESTAPKVLFTGVVDAYGERAVLALGGSLASSVAEASHLVTDRIRRTVKFLCALGRGIPIISLDWLHQSRKAGCFLPPAEYVVTDPEQEKNFGFSLREALSRAQERRLLEGYEIHVTPGVQPPPPQMGEIISCCGGTVLPSMPRSYKPQRVVITCSQDFSRCAIPFRVGLPILSPEFLLTGVLKQEAKPEAFVLSTLEMSST
ncbi:mediator of DNA damage checkpoint protein 1 isoform X4 [Mesoplodon densirostris]|uniref:mediator of DNA damage checkpoint protein 1 isoform X4 n=1 Tax=Mesoplodon densirostris TaxID=48708 RepID=UPI0028DC524D|nr:mediator of DNA damage checkpoint protein 1 isoform X4 [Mesoplodon densirostris]